MCVILTCATLSKLLHANLRPLHRMLNVYPLFEARRSVDRMNQHRVSYDTDY